MRPITRLLSACDFVELLRGQALKPPAARLGPGSSHTLMRDCHFAQRMPAAATVLNEGRIRLMKFADLGFSDALLKSIEQEGYTTPTPIQQLAIGHVLAGRDVLGIAQTGTGKTAAFALPILDRLVAAGLSKARGRKARVLVLSPTRELATQIATSFRAYGRHTGMRQAVVYGGVSQNPQAKAIRDGVDVIVATPGRLMDLMNQRLVSLAGIEMLVIDEADRMFDMGFIRDIQRIVSQLPTRRQTLLFSATMPRDIRDLADSVLNDPVRVQVPAKNPAAETVEQSVYFVHKRNKPHLLKHVIEKLGMTRAIVFTRTKHGADKVVRGLAKAGIKAEAIHGNKSQNARQRALANFKSDKPPVLVATDVAARGLDIDEVSHVVNFDLPNVAETYVHRIGRTGRAGATGIAVSFCDHEEQASLREIEKLLGKKTPVCDDHPEYPAPAGGPPESKGHKPSGPKLHKPHGEGPNDGRHRSRRRKFGKGKAPSVAGNAVPQHAPAASAARKPKAAKKPTTYTTMW
jgi:ATP-dependent RNA helicase RhlE